MDKKLLKLGAVKKSNIEINKYFKKNVFWGYYKIYTAEIITATYIY